MGRGWNDIAAVDLPPVRRLELHPIGARSGEAGSPAFTLFRSEAAVLVVRSLAIYIGMMLYLASYLEMKARLLGGYDFDYLVHALGASLALSAGVTLFFDLRFVVVLLRTPSSEMPSAVGALLSKIFPSPSLVMYYALVRGNGFTAKSRECVMLHAGFFSALCDFPNILIFTVLALAHLSHVWSITWLAFTLSFVNGLAGCFIMPWAFADPPRPGDDDVFIGDAGIKLEPN